MKMTDCNNSQLSIHRSQSIPPGYKQTEIGVFPKDWVISTLENITKSNGLVRGPFGGTLKKEFFSATGYKVYEQRNAIYETIQLGTYYVNEQKYRDLARFDIKPGDFIVSCSGTIGCIYRIPEEAPNGIINQALLKICIDPDKIDPYYFIIIFKSASFQSRIKDNTQGGAMQNLIGMSLFRQTQIPIPSLPEQHAIATALSDVDALIESLDKLIAKKRNIKQAAMQKLLTGKARLPGFDGNWEVKKLGELGIFLKGSGVKKEDAISGHLPCIRYGEIYTHHNDVIRNFFSWISPKVASNAVKLRKGDLLFAGSGETKEEIGKCVAFIDDYETYAGGDVVILRTTGVDPIFMGYYCNHTPINAQKASKGQGDAIVHISAAALSSILVLLPPQPEQTAIAAILSDMDTEIEALETRRAKTLDLKQGMMQELLTGKTRLVKPEVSHVNHPPL